MQRLARRNKEMEMKVLMKTKYGNLFGAWYDAGKPDTYGNSNEPVVVDGEDGPFVHVCF